MKCCWIAAGVLWIATPMAWGQVPKDYDLGGAKRPAPDLTFGDKQYKRIHQTSLRFILRGQLDRTERFLQGYLQRHPGDGETLYMLGILHGQRDQADQAESFFRRAVEAGLPEDRLVAGPRRVIRPVGDTALIRQLRDKYATRPVHGPLIGSTTDHSATFWVRTATAGAVKVIVSEDGDLQNSIEGTSDRSSAENDFTTVVEVDRLQPDREYFYGIRINDGPLRGEPHYRFRTFPTGGQGAQFAIAFGGGAGYVPEHERMWDTIAQFDPLALLLLGDNVYIDDPESMVMQQYTYHRRQSRPEWRRLTAGTSVFTIWDDHDFSTNDSWGGPLVDRPFWKRDWVLPIFRQNWANPGYGGGDALPGCYYNFQIADVDFLMLDCRYYRSDPRTSPRSMLGPTQLDWLKQKLLSAQGTFKVVCSSVPWDFRTKGDSLDTWNGYQREREEFFQFIEANNIDGVLLMSADRHRSDAWKIGRTDGYDFYEFNSSRLTNQHVHPTMKKAGAIFSYNQLQSFGLVTFDTTSDDPQVSYQVINIDGAEVRSLSVSRSQLE